MGEKDIQIREKVLMRTQKLKQEREDYWKKLKPFNTIDDIPNLPIVNKDEYNNFYVPILIKCGAIPKDKLIPGGKYKGACRNAEIAVWTGNKFIYDRTKFGTTYKETREKTIEACEKKIREGLEGYDFFRAFTSICNLSKTSIGVSICIFSLSLNTFIILLEVNDLKKS